MHSTLGNIKLNELFEEKKLKDKYRALLLPWAVVKHKPPLEKKSMLLENMMFFIQEWLKIL